MDADISVKRSEVMEWRVLKNVWKMNGFHAMVRCKESSFDVYSAEVKYIVFDKQIYKYIKYM